MSKTYKDEGVVLKRRNLGETDRLVTIFTKKNGKVATLAKGVRKITSHRASSLEPASQAVFFFAQAKTWDILTQTKLINSFAKARSNLQRLTQVHQILEIVDLLTQENQAHPQVYDVLLHTLKALNTNGNKRQLIIASTRKILQILGFGLPQDNSEAALKQHLEAIVDKQLRSKKMLTQ